MEARMVLAMVLIPKRLRGVVCDALVAETRRLRAGGYRPSPRRVLTDDDIRTLAEEAARGYDKRSER
jgi:hypothetical protein